jgi:flagellar protein FliO/FliZ
MKPGRHSFLFAAVLAASLASSPAFAQHSVSGTIAGRAPAEGAAASVPAAEPAAAGAAASVPAAASTSASSPANASATSSAAALPAMAMTLPAPAALPAPSAPSAPSATGSLLQTTLALLFVLALLVGLAWFLKRFGPKNFGGGSNTVRLVGALSVGARERILVVEVGEQWIVVGASPGRMNALATMPRQELPDHAPAPAGLQGANFAEWFKQTIEKRNGK